MAQGKIEDGFNSSLTNNVSGDDPPANNKHDKLEVMNGGVLTIHPSPETFRCMNWPLDFCYFQENPASKPKSIGPEEENPASKTKSIGP